MARKLIAVLSVFLIAASISSVAATRGPSTAEERAQALEYAQSLEQHPLAKDSLQKRMWLTEWIVQVPDITVNVCCHELKALQSLDKVNDTYSNQLRMQAVFSQAAFQLQHPEEKNTAAIAAKQSSKTAANRAGTLKSPLPRYSGD